MRRHTLRNHLLLFAGDATTVPYKQIVIAIGEAVLSAFDHLIPSTPVEVKEAAR